MQTFSTLSMIAFYLARLVRQQDLTFLKKAQLQATTQIDLTQIESTCGTWCTFVNNVFENFQCLSEPIVVQERSACQRSQRENAKLSELVNSSMLSTQCSGCSNAKQDMGFPRNALGYERFGAGRCLLFRSTQVRSSLLGSCRERTGLCKMLLGSCGPAKNITRLRARQRPPSRLR